MSGYSLQYYRDVNDHFEPKPNYGQRGASYVILVDPATGLPYVASGGGGGGGGVTTYTLSAPQTVAVNTTDGQIIPANAARKYLLIQVNGASDVALSFGATPATLAAGVTLSASTLGAGYPGDDMSNSHLGSVRAIARGQASSITYVEGV